MAPDDPTNECSVLLVEDTPAEVDLVRKVLRNADDRHYALTHVDRLEAALSTLAAGSFELVLLDLHLPDTQGLEGLGRIIDQSPRTPIVLLTNQDRLDLAVQALAIGAQDYLIKREIDTRLLTRAIRYAIERKRTADALSESEERFALAVEGANDGIWDWNLATGHVYYSARFINIIGANGEAFGTSIEAWLAQILERDREAFQAALDEHLAGTTRYFEAEHRVGSGDEARWILARGIAVRDEEGRPARLAGSITDISRRKSAEAQLLHDAMHDALTKLPNRALFMDHLDLSLRRFLRDDNKLFATLFFDLDRFKHINDSLGHAIGDQLLVEIGGRLKNCLRPGDTLARLGGDEFAILLNDIAGPTDAIYVAERVREQLEGAIQLEGHAVYTSASIGIAVSDLRYQRPEDILRDADLAMYRAKSEGNARYALFDTNMHEQALAQHRLETDLRRALERSEFVVYYQPIVAMDNGRVSGFEALLRWQQLDRGLVNPESFIDVAEETGLIIPIGWWVLEEACRKLSEWQRLFPADPPLSVSVNVSGRLFVTDDLTTRLAELLGRYQLADGSLRLEITENVVMDHGELAMSALHGLRELGVQLHIDDFGTGYSSLSYLQRFQYDSLKIDRSFVRSMSEKVDSSAIVEAIVNLGNTLGMRVIAEGVETPEQVNRLRAMRCPEAQGFWFSRPMAEADVVDYLESGISPPATRSAGGGS